MLPVSYDMNNGHDFVSGGSLNYWDRDYTGTGSVPPTGAPHTNDGEFLTGGLVKEQITRDQVVSLKSDNVVSDGAKGLADLGIKPVAVEAILPGYLWRFRPGGQYSDIQDSAKNLRAG